LRVKIPKLLCPHPQPLSHTWERGEENADFSNRLKL